MTRREARYGRYGDRYQDLRGERSLGNRKFGEAEVNCCFFTPEAKWGLIGEDNVGILYFAFTFSQNRGYRLDRTRVELTFLPSDPVAHSPPIVMKYFAPQGLFGPERGVNLTRWSKFNPHVDVSGIVSVNAIDFGQDMAFVRPYKWVFTGGRFPGENGAGLYQRLRWELESNKLEPQTEINRPIHGAVVIQHASVPFSVEVKIQGKLRGHLWRGMLDSKNNRTRGEIVPGIGNLNLKSEAEKLETDIDKRNDLLLPVTVEAPKTDPPKAESPETELPKKGPPDLSTTLETIMSWLPIRLVRLLVLKLFHMLGNLFGMFSGKHAENTGAAAAAAAAAAEAPDSPILVPTAPQIPETVLPAASGAVSSPLLPSTPQSSVPDQGGKGFKGYFHRRHKKNEGSIVNGSQAVK